MGMFSYIAKNKEGQEIRSSIEASTRLEALEALRKKGLTVVDLFGIEHEKAGAAPKATVVKPDKKSKRKSFQSAKVKMSDLAIFCRQLAISVNAGVPLRDALDTIGQELEHPRLQAAVMDMVGKLNDGKSFSEAVTDHPKIFNVMFCGLIKVAEESGKLPSTLQQLAAYLERTDKLQRRIKAMSAYPSFIAGFFVVVCLIMSLFILPQFTDIFGGFNAKLPFFTTLVFGINQFFIDYVIEIFAAVIVITAALIFYVRTPSGAYRKDKLKLATPYLGDLVMKYVLARFCRSLAIMVNSGVAISTALEICAEATGNRVLEKTVMDVRERIMTGHGIADSLAQSGVFPGLIVRMVSVGEDSGQLPEVLEKVADLYEDQVETSIMTTMSLFEPVVICVFGAFVLTIVLAIYLPIFTVSSSVQ
jgi:type IV pilus assembly protein PilC